MHQPASLHPISDSAATPSTSSSHTKQAWLIIGGWSLFLVLCLIARGGRVLIPLFPLSSIAVGLFLYFRAPVLYVGYAWWLVFIGSLIRRIIDQQSGYITPGRWSTTSLLVASISIITLVRYLPKISRYGGTPFLLALFSVTYGCLIGLITGKLSLQFMIGAMEWVIPIVFGFHLFANWYDYPHYRHVMQRSFVWGALVMGCYGIFQYIIAPEWDRFYLDNLSASSFGSPFPFEIRVFSTQESPQSFGMMMMASLILLLSSKGGIQLPASASGYIAFLLSAARSGWLGWAAALLTFLPSLKLKLQLRLIVTILLMAILVVPLATMEPFATPIQQRFESLSAGENDVSLAGRQEAYQSLWGAALSEFVGSGIGGRSDRNLPIGGSLGDNDSGILPLLFTLGWFGALPYLASIGLMLYRLLTTRESRDDAFSSASRAIVFGALAQVLLNNIFTGSMAMVLWSFLGISMAASQYYSHKRQVRLTESRVIDY